MGTVPSPPTKPSALLSSNGNIYSRGRTDYPGYAASQFASVKAAGAKGGQSSLFRNTRLTELKRFLVHPSRPPDGVTDDTVAIQNFINANWGCYILFFDAGVCGESRELAIRACAEDKSFRS